MKIIEDQRFCGHTISIKFKVVTNVFFFFFGHLNNIIRKRVKYKTILWKQRLQNTSVPDQKNQIASHYILLHSPKPSLAKTSLNQRRAPVAT